MTMEIVFKKHLQSRIKERRISKTLPTKIYQQAKERYFDTATGHRIAILKTNYLGKKRRMIVVYDEIDNRAELITAHPIRERDYQSRIKGGRYQ